MDSPITYTQYVCISELFDNNFVVKKSWSKFLHLKIKLTTYFLNFSRVVQIQNMHQKGFIVQAHFTMAYYIFNKIWLSKLSFEIK